MTRSCTAPPAYDPGNRELSSTFAELAQNDFIVAALGWLSGH
jgi:hypothetical protein